MESKFMANLSERILMHATGLLEQGHAICSGEFYFIRESSPGMILDKGAPSDHVSGTAHNELSSLRPTTSKSRRLSSSP